MKLNHYFKLYFLILLSLLTIIYTKDEEIECNDNLKANSNDESNSEMPRTAIQVDQIILGSLSTNEIDENCISELYEVILSQDSDTIEFDLQGPLINIYINVGGSSILTKNNSDFILYNPGRDSILTLNKHDILTKVNNKGIIVHETGSLKNVKLLIGLSSDKKDSTEYMLYSLRIHQPINKKDYLDIIRITSDHKIICKPKKVQIDHKDSNICLFIVDYNTMYNPNSIILHGFSSNPAAKINLFGSFIDRNVYDLFDINNLTQSIPNEKNAEYNIKTDDVNYIYITKLSKNKYIYISFFSDSENDIILLNSIPLPVKQSAYKININSYSEQLILYTGNKLMLNFPGTEDISADIVVLSGEGEINW